MLSATINMALNAEVVEEKNLDKVIADTTVMESNVRYPVDGQLLNRAREKLVREAKKQNMELRQSYARVGKKLENKAQGYAHARQYNRLKRNDKKLKTILGRTVRDVERQLVKTPEKTGSFAHLLTMSKRLLMQEKNSKNKLYSLHELSTYCIAKGKKRTPYEYGHKVSLVLTHKQGLALASVSLEKAAYDGHILRESIEQAQEICGNNITKIFVDQGYRGHGIEDKNVYNSGQRRGMTQILRKELKRNARVQTEMV